MDGPRGVVGRRWGALLLGVALGGALLRVGYVLFVLDGVAPGLDAIWYQLQGGTIRNGTGYVHPPSIFVGEPIATATFPPAYPAYQAVWQSVFGGGPTSVRLAGTALGAIASVLTGLLGRRVLGPAVGLAAAALVAVDPTLVAVDGSTMSEGLSVVVVLGVLLLAHRALAVEVPSTPTVVGLGVACGVAVLTRPDLLVLVALVALAVALRRRLVAAAAVLVIAGVVVVPWAWRNERAVGSFTVATISPSSALAGANCDRTFHGPDLGSWSYPCVVAATPTEGADEAAVATAQRTAAFDHLGDELARLPIVLAARELRVWGFWDPRDLARRDAEESRRYGWQLLSRPLDAALAVVGGAGLLVLARQRRRTEPGVLLLLAPLVVVAAGAAATYGNPRFAAIAHPALVLGVVALLDQAVARRRLASTSKDPTPMDAAAART